MTVASTIDDNISTLKAINRVRQGHKCHSLSEISSANGMEVDVRFTNKTLCDAIRNNHDWPFKTNITLNGFRVWEKFLSCICKYNTFILLNALGDLIHHTVENWITT